MRCLLHEHSMARRACISCAKRPLSTRLHIQEMEADPTVLVMGAHGHLACTWLGSVSALPHCCTLVPATDRVAFHRRRGCGPLRRFVQGHIRSVQEVWRDAAAGYAHLR